RSPNQAVYTSGTVVTLTATPNSGYTFSSWSGDLTGTSSPTTITMDGNKSVNANFSVIVVAPVGCTNRVQDGDEEGIDCGGSCEFSCPTNWKSGISVLFNGTPGIDYAEGLC
ncbi:MAG: cell wall-binding protein, partial [Deltaproteobacteria bacterium]|nr:cell wall-binding protein [Deltaproteobacteria bacterium]